jgi:hypothetical protein
MFGFLNKTLFWRKSGDMKRITTGEVDMNEVAMLQGAEPRRILQSVLEKKVPAILTYLSRGKWHVAKGQVTDIGACSLNVRIFRTKKPHPLNIRVDQPVGLSLKYGYGKLIFETKVIALEPSFDGGSGGTLVLEVPGRIQVVQRRSYFRVDVPGIGDRRAGAVTARRRVRSTMAASRFCRVDIGRAGWLIFRQAAPRL